MTNEPKYGSGYSAGNNYPTGSPTKRKRTWLWWLLGIIALIIILGAVLGGVFGSRAANDNKENSATSSNDNAGVAGSGAAVAATASRTAGSAQGAVVPTSTDALGNPIYPTSTGTARIAAPALTVNSALSCPNDTYTATGTGITVRPDHPVLLAPASRWSCLPKLIAADSYMASWNATIFGNATRWYNMDPVPYISDGALSDSGVLDVARQVQQRLMHWGYAYKLSNDTKWVDRAWLELTTASGNTTTSFGTAGNNWNTAHFLDVAEFTAAFAYGYDWFYDAWNEDQRTALRTSIVQLGLRYGLNAYTNAQSGYSWWTSVNGNWNCVCNGGLIAGALAILNDDTTGIAQQVLDYAVPNNAANCMQGPSSDGTWSETANYWYFGTYSAARTVAALKTATGSDQGQLAANSAFQLTGLYHMYVTGMQGLFAYGDTGPNKFVANANGMFVWGKEYNRPEYSLFQRDRQDAAEVSSMLYYDPQVTGDWWYNLPLDHHFENNTDAWVSARSSWTSTEGAYFAMKAGALKGHQTHGDLDVGTFVLDFLGQRFAGELGNADYLGTGYFSSEDDDSERWLYYRKRTEGQNTLMLNDGNQLAEAVPTTTFGSTGEAQTALTYVAPDASTAFMTADMTSAYSTPAKRGIRFINGRKQVLIQDEITVPAGTDASVQWRMHTNATVTMSNGNTTATLALGGKTVQVNLLSPSGAVFYTQAPVRLPSDPALPPGALSADQPNAPATVLTILLGAGTQQIQVLFNPQWEGMAANQFVTPPTVAIDSWSTTSHN